MSAVARSSLLSEVTSKTRDDVAVEALGRAHRRIRKLEAELEGALGELAAAQDACAETGIVFELELEPAVAAAFSAWKVRHGERSPAAQIVDEEFGR